MEDRYIQLMDLALAAYPPERILAWFDRVQAEGVTEHGFARLTADIGILIAHGRHRELLPLYCRMMTFVCHDILHGHCANDFSVKELIFSILEIRGSGLVPAGKTDAWLRDLARLHAPECYDKTAPDATTRNNNWGCFASASEYMREYAGLCDAQAFLDTELASQLLSFDENGMYRDPNEPAVYDIVPRAQLCVLLRFGYRGRHAARIRELLKKGARMTLGFQSVTGEIPYGGRSNQFLFNEAIEAALCEYSAVLFAEDGDLKTAGELRDAAALAVDAVFDGLRLYGGKTHIKNRFACDSGFGCEKYAYFDKYMITLASFAYLGHLFAAPEIALRPCPARLGGYTLGTSPYFHRFCAAAGGYFTEADIAADPHYDATGVGRIHKRGVPPALGLSVPFAKHPKYRLPTENPRPLALAGGIVRDGVHFFPSDGGECLGWRPIDGKEVSSEYIHQGPIPGAEASRECFRQDSLAAAADEVRFALRYRTAGAEIRESWTVNAGGVHVTAECPGERVVFPLPLFSFDGEEHTAVTCRKGCLRVRYRGSSYSVTTDGALADTGEDYANRNGLYRLYTAEADGVLHLHFTLETDAEEEK